MMAEQGHISWGYKCNEHSQLSKRANLPNIFAFKNLFKKCSCYNFLGLKMSDSTGEP